jgi:hypothetical protein
MEAVITSAWRVFWGLSANGHRVSEVLNSRKTLVEATVQINSKISLWHRGNWNTASTIA